MGPSHLLVFFDLFAEDALLVPRKILGRLDQEEGLLRAAKRARGKFGLAGIRTKVFEVVHVSEIVVRISLIVFVMPFVGLGCGVLVLWLVEFKLDAVRGAVAVVSEVGPSIVAANHMLAFGGLGLLSVLTVADLPE